MKSNSNPSLGRIVDVVRRSIILATVILLALVSVFSGCASEGWSPLAAQERLRVATTTSLYDTGLWGYLEPKFEKEYGVELDVLYAGTGKALEWGRRGDVDVITVHDKAREEQFVADGYGVERIPFAYNYFVIVGPEGDPAGIKDMDPVEAFNKLIEEGQTNGGVKFVSRGDDSGTHATEKGIWQAAGYDYEDVRASGAWYIEAGGGMGPTLVMASEKSAYTLSDMGTYLAFKGDLSLVPLVDQGDILLNVYSVIAVNPEKIEGVKIEMANKLIDFLLSEEIQELIGEYGVKEYGLQLFIPCAGQDL
jgi:tungstate transport system substrate-binding protein